MDSKSAKELARKLLSPKRYKHSEYVARAAAAMAARFDCDEEKALTAAYLHDIAKEMPQADLLQLLSGTDIINDKDVMAAPPVLHSFAGAEYIKKLGVADEDVLNAVRYHTTGRPDMSRLEIIIYLADYTSDDRKFAGVEQLRAGRVAVEIIERSGQLLAGVANATIHFGQQDGEFLQCRLGQRLDALAGQVFELEGKTADVEDGGSRL